MRIVSLCLLSNLALLSACAADGEGTVKVTAYGESFIEDGIPASAVDDGWAVDFRRFEVSVRDVTVADTSIEVEGRVDLAAASSGGGHKLGSALVAAGAYTDSSYTIAKVEIDGTATKGAVSKAFDWTFEQPTRYAQCASTT